MYLTQDLIISAYADQIALRSMSDLPSRITPYTPGISVIAAELSIKIRRIIFYLK